jgi:hypothetical protein
MLNFTMISGLIARTSPRATNSRRKSRASLGLESLEGRELMGGLVITGPPVSQPPPSKTMPPIVVTPPQKTLPPSPAPPPINSMPPSNA